jgi:hypothetical protein
MTNLIASTTRHLRTLVPPNTSKNNVTMKIIYMLLVVIQVKRNLMMSRLQLLTPLNGKNLVQVALLTKSLGSSLAVFLHAFGLYVSKWTWSTQPTWHMRKSNRQYLSMPGSAWRFNVSIGILTLLSIKIVTWNSFWVTWRTESVQSGKASCLVVWNES